MLTQAKLKELLHYSPRTGVFTWKVRACTRRPKGSEAGHTIPKHRRGRTSYRRIIISSKCYFSHRLAWLYVTGKWPVEDIDHINGDGTDNRWVNLRQANAPINAKNRPLPKNNTSGVNGVVWHKKARKWQAGFSINRRYFYLGLFNDLNAAKAAREKADIENNFHLNHGRCML